MDFSKVKMIVSDMDGTLLNHEGMVSERFFNQFKELKKRNIHFVAASGRQYQSITDKLESIKHEISIIGENGGIMQFDNKTEILLTLSKRDVINVVQLIRDVENSYIVLCGIKAAYIETEDEKFISILSNYYASYEVVTDLTKSIEDEFLKIAIYHFDSSEDYILPHIEHLRNDMQVTVSGQNWLDISHFDANKAYALSILQKRLNISTAETMVFGDYNNDLQMLKLADFSFAMKNAHPDVKKIARYETESNLEQGVESIIDQLIRSRDEYQNKI